MSESMSTTSSTKFPILYIVIAVAVIALLAAGIGWFMFLRATGGAEAQEQELSAQVDALEQQLDDTEAEHAEQVNRLQSQTERLEAQFVEAETAKTDLETQLQELEEKNTFLSDQFDEAVSEREAFRRRYETMQDVVSCGETVEINYASHADVSNSLRKYIEEISGSVEDVNWDVVFNNSTTSIHRLRTSEYLFPYVVFFGDHGTKQTVFSITGSCFLDVAEE